jgi:hypothetical protein
MLNIIADLKTRWDKYVTPTDNEECKKADVSK